MTTGPFLWKILRFSIPLICSAVLQQLFNTADIIVLGKCAGEESLAAVGSTGALVHIFLAMSLGVSNGVNVVVAQAIGAKNRRAAHQNVHTAVLLSLIGGVSIGLIAWLLSPVFLRWMHMPQSLIPLATLYLRLYFCGMPATMIYNAAAGVLRAMGDSKHPLFYLTVSGILNVVLNLVFVIVAKWDVAGVAVATVLSQTVALVMIVIKLMRQNNECRLVIKKLRLYTASTRQILLIGVPSALHSMIFSLSNMVLQSAVNSFGVDAIAGVAASNNIGAIGYIPIEGCAATTTTFISQNVGAGRYDQVKKLTGMMWLFTTVVCMISCGIIYLFRIPLLYLYTDSSAAVAIAASRMFTVLLGFINGWVDVFSSSCRGMGESLLPTISSLISICGFRLIWIFGVLPLHRTIPFLYLCYPLSWTIATVLLILIWIRVLKRSQAALSAARRAT